MYPFGMQMPSRIYSTDKYRYSINGQEKSSEIGINLTTAEFWQYDARIVRRWNVDPVVKVGESLYAVFGNNPILVVDPSGADTLTFTRNLYKDKRSPYKGHGVRVNQNYELQGSIEIKAGEGPDIFYYRENITSFTDNGKEFSTSLIQFNPQGQFPYTSGGRIMKGFHDDQYALAAMAPDWLIKHYYNKWLSKTGNERDWPTTKAWGTAMAYRKDVRFARTLKNITDIVYMAFGAGALLKGTLTPAIAEAFPAGFATSQFEGFYIRSASTMANGTYTKTIQTLAFMGESGSGNLTKLVRSIEIEARAAGANTLQINGIEIVNSRILSTSKAAAEKFGFTFEQISANSIKLTKILK